MAVIKRTNVTVNWYKSTKTLQIQGINRQMVKKLLDELIWTPNYDGNDTSQVEFDSGFTKGDSAAIVASSSNEGKKNRSHYTTANMTLLTL